MFIFSCRKPGCLKNIFFASACVALVSGTYATPEDNSIPVPPALQHPRIEDRSIPAATNTNLFDEFTIAQQESDQAQKRVQSVREKLYNSPTLTNGQRAQLAAVRFLKHPVTSKVLPCVAAVGVTILSNIDFAGSNTSLFCRIVQFAEKADRSSVTHTILGVGFTAIPVGTCLLVSQLRSKVAERLEANVFASLQAAQNLKTAAGK